MRLVVAGMAALAGALTAIQLAKGERAGDLAACG
jgi:hypothetical protein